MTVFPPSPLYTVTKDTLSQSGLPQILLIRVPVGHLHGLGEGRPG